MEKTEIRCPKCKKCYLLKEVIMQGHYELKKIGINDYADTYVPPVNRYKCPKCLYRDVYQYGH